MYDLRMHTIPCSWILYGAYTTFLVYFAIPHKHTLFGIIPGLRLLNLPKMSMFLVNPLSDMRANISELCVMQWRHETLGVMSVTYSQMAVAGMTPRIMSFFRFPLSDWVALGLRAKHTEHWTEGEATGTFSMGLAELRLILHHHSAP